MFRLSREVVALAAERAWRRFLDHSYLHQEDRLEDSWQNQDQQQHW